MYFVFVNAPTKQNVICSVKSCSEKAVILSKISVTAFLLDRKLLI